MILLWYTTIIKSKAESSLFLESTDILLLSEWALSLQSTMAINLIFWQKNPHVTVNLFRSLLAWDSPSKSSRDWNILHETRVASYVCHGKHNHYNFWSMFWCIIAKDACSYRGTIQPFLFWSSKRLIWITNNCSVALHTTLPFWQIEIKTVVPFYWGFKWF